MKMAHALVFLGLLVILSPAADARRLLQDSTTITDNDILNFALNLEVNESLPTCVRCCFHPVKPSIHEVVMLTKC